MSEIIKEDLSCFVPEKDIPYPLCIGKNPLASQCEECQLYTDYEPEDYE